MAPRPPCTHVLMHYQASQHEKKQNNKQANPTTPYSFKNKSIVVKMVVKIIIFGHFSLSTLATRATTAYTVPRTCRRKHCHEASLMKSSA